MLIDARLAGLGKTIVYVISNYPNDSADIHWGCRIWHYVSGGACVRRKGSVESPVGVSEWWLVNKALLFQTQSRLVQLQQGFPPLNDVSQVNPVKISGTFLFTTLHLLVSLSFFSLFSLDLFTLLISPLKLVDLIHLFKSCLNHLLNKNAQGFLLVW